ncbi:chromosome partitioning ATPase [Salinarchaeum sp. Harcht-Bsk1]|uniref:MinD/ParA family ATP-binding protein n=1 Tax=Salinarchaeum sp. Harcht-Bsk1 TaxID=1333523 RepID=UPI000342296C|nr:division plane positioning ATPase MipZ [Salinarchaeum sp. Harcht-Bsk1]AGN00340.1 chromosome partitioning ATPase [Salinarchaeum sp. Harcht-Bsk1]
MIAIAGGKGGCGKTTTTLGIARSLEASGIGGRAIDLDAGMPNLHRMADVDREPPLAALVDEEGGAEIQRDSHGVEIVPAPRALAALDLSSALDAVQPRDGVALFDCPAGAGPAATAPLREAEAVILVSTSREESVEDAAKTGRMARSLGVPVLGAVVTRTQRVSRGVASELAAEQTVAIPTRGEPLTDDRVRECYDAVAGWIETWLQRRGREKYSEAERSDTTVTVRKPAIRGDRSESRTCPCCGGIRPARSSDERATDRRDRRSRRSRAARGTRSSWRGGGALSGRR